MKSKRKEKTVIIIKESFGTGKRYQTLTELVQDFLKIREFPLAAKFLSISLDDAEKALITMLTERNEPKLLRLVMKKKRWTGGIYNKPNTAGLRGRRKH